MITQPEYLTKDRLKAELKKNGVSFEPNENKDYYVQLYKKHIMHGKGSRVKGRRSEFSSDEELTTKYSLRRTEKQQVEARRPVKVKVKVAKVDTYLSQVQQLTDQELLDALKELSEGGEEPGPITDTTRSVYQRQLARHMAEKAKASSKAREEVDYGGDYMGEWSSGASEEEESEGEEAAAAKREDKVTVTRKLVVVEDRPSPRQSTRLRERVFVQEDHSRREKLPQKLPAVARRSEPPLPKQAPVPKGQRGGGAGALSCNWSFLFSFLLLVGMFVVTFLAYDFYTNDNSLLSRLLAAITAAFQGSSQRGEITD